MFASTMNPPSVGASINATLFIRSLKPSISPRRSAGAFVESSAETVGSMHDAPIAQMTSTPANVHKVCAKPSNAYATTLTPKPASATTASP
jgi:hypothetical protein